MPLSVVLTVRSDIKLNFCLLYMLCMSLVVLVSSCIVLSPCIKPESLILFLHCGACSSFSICIAVDVLISSCTVVICVFIFISFYFFLFFCETVYAQRKQAKGTKRKTRQAKALENAKRAPRSFIEVLHEVNHFHVLVRITKYQFWLIQESDTV